MTFDAMPVRIVLLLVAVVTVLILTRQCAFAQKSAEGDRATAMFAGSKMIVRDRLSVEVIGRGPDLIFIPGLSSSRATWRATAERLKSRYRLHLVQVAGFAGEPARANADGDVVVPTAEAIHAYIVEQHLMPATLIGHSLGGTISLYLAQTHPGDIGRIMIVDALPFLGVIYGGPDATPASIKAMTDSWRSGQSGWSPQMADQMMAAMATAPADVDLIKSWSRASDAAVVMRALIEDMMLDLRPGLPRVTPPLTVLYPDYAPPGLPGEAHDAMYRAAYAPVPRKTIVRIDNSRHFIMFDQPEKFAAALDAFLAEGR